MKDLLKRLNAEDLLVKLLLKEGKPHKVISDEAERVKADIIIIGTSTKSNISKLILGTTASYVIEHTKIPVLVVPQSC